MRSPGGRWVRASLAPSAPTRGALTAWQRAVRHLQRRRVRALFAAPYRRAVVPVSVRLPGQSRAAMPRAAAGWELDLAGARERRPAWSAAVLQTQVFLLAIVAMAASLVVGKGSARLAGPTQRPPEGRQDAQRSLFLTSLASPSGHPFQTMTSTLTIAAPSTTNPSYGGWSASIPGYHTNVAGEGSVSVMRAGHTNIPAPVTAHTNTSVPLPF